MDAKNTYLSNSNQKTSNGFLIFYIVFVSIVTVGALALSIIVLLNPELFKPKEPEQPETKSTTETVSNITVPDAGANSTSTMSILDVESSKQPNKTFTSTVGPFQIFQQFNNSSQLSNSEMIYNAEKLKINGDFNFTKKLTVNNDILQYINNSLITPKLTTADLSTSNINVNYLINQNVSAFFPYSTGNVNNRVVTITLNFNKALQILTYTVTFNTTPQFNYDSTISDFKQPAKIFIFNDYTGNSTQPLGVNVVFGANFGNNGDPISPGEIINGLVIDIIYYKLNINFDAINSLNLISNVPNDNIVKLYYTYCGLFNVIENNYAQRQLNQNVVNTLYSLQNGTCKVEFLTYGCGFRVNKIYFFSKKNDIYIHVESYNNFIY